MDCADSLTNLVCIHDWSSVPFVHLQFSNPKDNNNIRLLRTIEAKWRRRGVLVSLDSTKHGLYIFGSTKDSDPYDKIKSTSIVSNDGSVKVEGQTLSRDSRGLYECHTLLGRPRISPTNSSSYMPRSKPAPQGSDNIVRAAQALNARAAQTNMLLTAKQDSIQNPNALDGVSRDPTSLSLVHEAFMSSILGLLVAQLCTEQRYMPLNATTLIYPSPIADESFSKPAITNHVSMVSLDLQITALGNLVLRAVSSIPTGLAKISQNTKNDDIYKGATVWLVPGGCVAAYMGIAPEDSQPDSGAAVGKDVQLLETTSVQIDWKIRCLAWLSEKGIDSESLEDCTWSIVIIETSSWSSVDDMPHLNGSDSDKVPVLWPTPLCFYRSFFEKSQPVRNGSGPPRLLTNSSGSINLAEDPLAFAENWSTEKSDRDKMIIKRQKDREVSDAATKTQVDMEAKVSGFTALSPIALRRSSVTGAVYPTPPDAIHHTTGATPSMDGTVSTPIANQATPANPRDPPSAVKESSYNLTDLWDPSQMENSNNVMNIDETSNDNLFDDMGGDLFGDTDITDADFNFFDEPDAAQNDLSDFLPEPILEDQNIDTKMIGTEENSTRISDPSSGGQSVELSVPVPEMALVTSESALPPPELLQLEDPSTDSEAQRPPLPSPAFNRDFVFSRIIPDFGKTKMDHVSAISPSFPDRSLKYRRTSTYDKVALKPSSTFTSKYKSSGSFQGILAWRGNRRKPPTELPVTGFLNKSKSRAQSISEFTEAAQPVDLSGDGSPNRMQEDDELVLVNENNTNPSISSGNLAIMEPSVSVKRRHDGEIKSGNASPTKIVAISDKTEDGSAIPNDMIFESLDANPADWSLAKFYSHPQPSSTISINLSSSNFIAAVQILADQAATWSSQRPSILSDWPFPTEKEQSDSNILAVKSQQDLSTVAKKIFQDAKDCTFAEALDIKDLPAVPQSNKLPPRPNPPRQRLPDGQDQDEASKKSPLILLPMSHLDLRRADSKMTVLPSALPFWENLSLSPSNKEKDVTALFIYPNADGMVANVKALFDRLRSAYESSRLGSHEILEGTGQTTAQIPLAPGAFEQLPSAESNPGIMEKFCSALGKQLALVSTLQSRNIVIYFVCPSESERAPLLICHAFHTLFEAYRQALAQKKMKPQTELVLQIVPSNLVASETEMVIPAPKEYTRLAMEVYDRCMNFKNMSKSSAVVLEQPLPKSLSFKVGMIPSISLMEENSCIHIAYAQSIDERWITAAWTDNTGVQQMTASYCLGRRNEPLTRSFHEVANEIWETTLDVIRAKKIQWRIMIAKSGVMQQSEIGFWSDLASTEIQPNITLTLLTISTRPSLALIPPSITLPPNTFSTQAMLSTPVSTPQPSILSPDQFGNATTPVRDGITSAATPEAVPLELDTDATLIDITDQTWAAILAMRLNNSNSVLDIAPALISGYLVKRSGPRVGDPPILMEVNIVHVDTKDGMRSARGLETVFREVLGYYKGLGTLARARGLVDQFRDIRPWHIAAAEKALKALYMLM